MPTSLFSFLTNFSVSSLTALIFLPSVELCLFPLFTRKEAHMLSYVSEETPRPFSHIPPVSLSKKPCDPNHGRTLAFCGLAELTDSLRFALQEMVFQVETLKSDCSVLTLARYLISNKLRKRVPQFPYL